MATVKTVLTKIWYSKQHLNLLNFIKGHTSEITDTNPLVNQIDVYYISTNRFIRSITSGRLFNPFFVVGFVLFMVLHMVTLPFYISVYASYLLINTWRVCVYAWNPEILELQARSIFKRFPNQWIELVYNMVFRRAVIAAFATIYKFSQLVKDPKRTSTGACGLPILLSKLLVLLLLRLVWVSLFQVSWQIVSRSYRFAMAFSRTRGYKYFRINIIRTRIINNYQLDDLSPGLYLRIYKDGKSKWNFNPYLSKYLHNRKASYLLESSIFKDLMEGIVDETDTFVYKNHVTCGYTVGTVKGREIELLGNNTSGLRRDWPHSFVSYESPLPLKSKIQSMTFPHFEFTDSLDKQPLNYGLDDFRTFIGDHRMLNFLLISKLLSRDQTVLDLFGVRNFMRSAGLDDAQFIMDPELKSGLNVISQLHESNPSASEFWTSDDELSYFTQVLYHYEPKIFTNVDNFKLHKLPHSYGSYDDFNDGFL